LDERKIVYFPGWRRHSKEIAFRTGGSAVFMSMTNMPLVLYIILLVEMYTRKNAQVVTNLQQTCSNAFPTTCLQDDFALLVPSCCNKFGTSCEQLVIRLMASSDL
jgi:hypothetical protein